MAALSRDLVKRFEAVARRQVVKACFLGLAQRDDVELAEADEGVDGVDQRHLIEATISMISKTQVH